jgi:hypothetical protein
LRFSLRVSVAALYRVALPFACYSSLTACIGASKAMAAVRPVTATITGAETAVHHPSLQIQQYNTKKVVGSKQSSASASAFFGVRQEYKNWGKMTKFGENIQWYMLRENPYFVVNGAIFYNEVYVRWQ